MATKRELLRVEVAEWVRRARTLMSPAEPKPEPPPCPAHPDWRPQRRLIGQPQLPASLCPYCAAEADEKPTGPPVFLDGGIPRPEHPSDGSWKAHQEALVARGEPVPGTAGELLALERIDDLRSQVVRARKGRVVSQRIEGCQLVQYVKRPGRRGLTRVTL